MFYVSFYRLQEVAVIELIFMLSNQQTIIDFAIQ